MVQGVIKIEKKEYKYKLKVQNTMNSYGYGRYNLKYKVVGDLFYRTMYINYNKSILSLCRELESMDKCDNKLIEFLVSNISSDIINKELKRKYM